MIGLSVITYNRPDYLNQNLKSLVENNFGGANIIYIIEDNSNNINIINKNKSIVNSYCTKGINKTIITFKHIILDNNIGVGGAKNVALKAMMDSGCDHLFLMEDDILMKNPQTCNYYIRTAEKYGIQHLNFGLHGEMNKGKGFLYKGMFCYPDCVGAFSYYTREVIDKVGYMDEEFVNAWEHVEHTYRIIEAGYHPEFWHFADCPINYKLLEEIPGSIKHSSIRPRSDWQMNINRGRNHWIAKHGKWLPNRPQK